EVAGHPEHVAATLGLGLARLAQDTPDAVTILRLLAFLAPEPVPLGVLLGQGDLGDPAVAATVGPRAGDGLAGGEGGAARRGWCRGAAGLLAGVAGRGRPGAGAPPGPGRHPRRPARRSGRAVAASRRRPNRSRGPRGCAAADELAVVCGAAAPRPGCPGPDQR